MKIEQHGNAVRFSVRVQPRASRTELAGSHGEAVKVRLQAVPVDGAANEALIDFLSELFAVPSRDVRIVTGAQSRSKLVEIVGRSADDARRILTASG